MPDEVVSELKNREILIEDTDLYNFYHSTLLKFNSRYYNRENLVLILAPTTACNFDCPYCFESKNNPKTMSDETIAELGNFVKNFEGAKSVSLTWYGGEPLIAFEQIKKIHKVLSAEGMPEISSQSVITNGYCFNDEVISFFRETGCTDIQITIDGVGSKHDKTRCLKHSSAPTFDTIVSNIERIIEKLPDTRISIRVNVNRLNLENFRDIHEFFKKKFPDNDKLNVYPGLIREETPDNISLCQSSFTPSQILEMNQLIREMGIDTSDFPYRKQRGCVMHSIAGFVIGPEGEIYKCWNDVGNPNGVIGNISQKELSNESLFIKYSVGAIPFDDECKNCHAFPICDGGCSLYRYRNRYTKGKFDICSPYKDKNALINALLTNTLKLNK